METQKLLFSNKNKWNFIIIEGNDVFFSDKNEWLSLSESNLEEYTVDSSERVTEKAKDFLLSGNYKFNNNTHIPSEVADYYQLQERFFSTLKNYKRFDSFLMTFINSESKSLENWLKEDNRTYVINELKLLERRSLKDDVLKEKLITLYTKIGEIEGNFNYLENYKNS